MVGVEPGLSSGVFWEDLSMRWTLSRAGSTLWRSEQGKVREEGASITALRRDGATA